MPKKKKTAEAAYEAYKKKWIREHIDNDIMEMTMANYDNRDEDDDDMTFDEYVEEYGFANGMCYVCFDEFVNNELS